MGQTIFHADSTKIIRRTVTTKIPKPITTELSAGIRLNTDGYSIFVERGKVKSEETRFSDKFYDINFFSAELTEHHHPKEAKNTNSKLANATGEKGKPYVYGKINNFYALKLGYGKRKMIAGKPDPGTISIHWVYAGGLSIGFLKPYYIDAYVLQDNPSVYVKKSIKYGDDTKEDFIRYESIIGRTGWSKGLGEVKIVPGLHAKTGFNFDFAATPKTKLALEVGIAAEIYTSKIEIMAEQKSSPFLFNAYVSLQFGKRW